MFPFHAHKHERNTKYIHIISLIVGIILPAVVPVIALFVDGYTMFRFPPTICSPSNVNVLYYGVILPVSIAVCVGLTFLAIILHALHEVSTNLVAKDILTKLLKTFSSSLLFLYFCLEKATFQTPRDCLVFSRTLDGRKETPSYILLLLNHWYD